MPPAVTDGSPAVREVPGRGSAIVPASPVAEKAAGLDVVYAPPRGAEPQPPVETREKSSETSWVPTVYCTGSAEATTAGRPKAARPAVVTVAVAAIRMLRVRVRGLCVGVGVWVLVRRCLALGTMNSLSNTCRSRTEKHRGETRPSARIGKTLARAS